MIVRTTSLPGVCIIELNIIKDSRGFFCEVYNREKYAEIGITSSFVQDNHSRSVCHTLRGLHYQVNKGQAKLCWVVVGEVQDVVVDIRRNSPFFGKWESVILSAENKRQLYIPKGFAHGFLVLSDFAELLYKCDEFYSCEDERGIAWNDPTIAVKWHIEETPLLSEKDAHNPFLSDIPSEYLPPYINEGKL
jgi:dTDP-4-dehydrorhamnose 3,5-epimerase